jgi:hypothetical protein
MWRGCPPVQALRVCRKLRSGERAHPTAQAVGVIVRNESAPKGRKSDTHQTKNSTLKLEAQSPKLDPTPPPASPSPVPAFQT